MPHTPSELTPSIFRAYDIRGVVENELTPAVVECIGQVFGSMALEAGEKNVFMARDGRLSGPELSKALAKGIQASGCHVVDLGVVPTPVLYFATFHCKEVSRSGVMLTGSHNPKNYNGLKMVLQQGPLSGDQITHIYDRIVQGEYQQGEGHYCDMDILPAYRDKITETVTLRKPLKVVVDAGNGVGAVTGPGLYRALGCEVTELYCEVDGHFPNHHPDPSKPENLQALINAVKQEGADVGLAFDGDADRLGVITPKGKIIWPDRQMMLYAQAVLKSHPGSEIVFDVKCTKYLADTISANDGRPVMNATGHSLMKQKLKESGAPLAGEMSGHTFFNDKWYGFDDGAYTGARLLEIVAGQDQDLDTLFEQFPEGVSTPEINIPVSDAEKFGVVEALSKKVDFPEVHIVTVDGVRIEFEDGWGLVRASNTTPCLVTRFEADTEAALARIQRQFRQLLVQFVPEEVIPFGQ